MADVGNFDKDRATDEWRRSTEPLVDRIQAMYDKLSTNELVSLSDVTKAESQLKKAQNNLATWVNQPGEFDYVKELAGKVAEAFTQLEKIKKKLQGQIVENRHRVN